MTKVFIFIFLFTFCGASLNAQSIITITNSLPLQRSQEIVEIPWSQVLSAYPSIDTTYFKVVNAKTKREYPFQLEYKGTPTVQNLLVQVSIPANASVQLLLLKGKATIVTPKTFCRYVPERKDDFAWENDRIAFRMYGKELEKTPKEMAYGVDVWVKRTDRLVLNERYKRAEYHVDHGDGMDYYHVGLTLGAGGVAPYVNDTIWYSKNYTQWKVLDNGPLRSAFQLKYDEWNAGGQQVNVVKTISLDAGSQLSKVEAVYTFSYTVMPVAIGIIKRKENGAELFNEQQGVMAYWEPMHGKDGTTGVGCIFTKPVREMTMTKEHLLTAQEIKQNEKLVYYSGAAWDKAGLITSAQQWFNYLDTFKKKLEQPLQIKWRKI